MMMKTASATRPNRVLLLPFLLVFLSNVSSISGASRQLLESTWGQPRGTDPLSNSSSVAATCTLTFDADQDSCSRVNDLCSNVTCQFVTEAESCTSEAAILSYFHFLYCVMPVNLIALSMIILFLWLFFLFIFLGTTADEYFCPSLIVMSQLLKLNQNLAGVTLLALGNGAPDIFSAFAAISNAKDGKAGLAIGALFGAGMFVTTIVTGAVSIYKPFTLTQRPFMRDVIFYIFAVYLTFYVLWSNTVELYQAIVFVGMYALYVLVVFVGRVLYQRLIKKRLRRQGDIPRPPLRPEGEEMAGGESTAATDGEDVQNDEELNTTTAAAATATHHLPSRGPWISASDDDDSSPSPPPALDTTPLLLSRPARNYSSTNTAGSTAGSSGGGSSEQQGGSSGASINFDLERSLQQPLSSTATNRLRAIRENGEGEEDSDVEGAAGLTVSLPTSFSPPPPEGSMQSSRSHRRLPITDLDEDDDDTYQAKLLAIQQESRRRRKIRRTISGALDITEDLGVAILGNKDISRVCDHVPPTPEPSSDAGMPNVSSFLSALRNRNIQKKPHPFRKMLRAIWPLEEDFRGIKWYYKIMEICKIPSSVLLALTVPVVDYDEDDHKWNRWLNIMHCVTGPLTMSLLIQLDTGPLGFLLLGSVLPLWSVVFCAGVLLATVVAFTSENERPPKYHGPVFSLLGFISAIVWIYVIANEIVALLQAMGVVMMLSDAVLGLTLLAWGNSIGDAISNFTMAKQGFPRMAISACFGGPLLNMLLGIGIASIVKSIKSGSLLAFQINFTSVELISGCLLMLSLCFQLVAVQFMGFKMRRPYGAILIGFYITFVVLAILTEYDVIPIHIAGVTQDH